MKITLAGIGVRAGDMTLAALNAAKNIETVFLRTALSDSGKNISALGIKAKSFDYLYESSRNFDTLSKKIAREVLNAAKTLNVVYLVDGDVTDDVSCRIILEKRKGKDVEIINGVSRADACASAVGLGGRYLKLSAYELKSARLTLPLVITDVDNAFKASEVKLAVSDAFGDDIPCYKFVNDTFKEIKLYEYDFEDDFDYSSAIVVPDLDYLHKSRHGFSDLIEIVKALRAENGCPWDKAQTKESVLINLIEEAYELVDAVKCGDEDGMQEETGDLLLQAAFQIIFAIERGAFTDRDVLSGICNKLISRHTHVFGSDKAASATDALSVWNKNKQKEKGYSSGAEYVSAVPKSFPALLRAEKVSKRAAKYNLDFSSEKQIFDKIKEECEEVKAAIKTGDENNLKEELGDLLFSVTNLLRYLGVEAEEALNVSTEKFIDRFIKAEKAAAQDGKNLKDMTKEEADKYYDAVKKS